MGTDEQIFSFMGLSIEESVRWWKYILLYGIKYRGKGTD